MMALTFDIHLLSPLLVKRLKGDPNSAISYPYVPGSVIRGALAVRYYQQYPKLDVSDPDSRRLFFDGSTRYLNAYPLERLKKRTLPVPLSWFREKEEPLGDGSGIYNVAVDEAFLDHPQHLEKQFCTLGEEQDNEFYDDDAPADEDYWQPEPPTVEFTDVEWHIAIHTARERVKGRATFDTGALFRYQALAAEQCFGGVILVSSSDDANTVEKWLEGRDFWLGKSRSAGYGRVRIENLQRVPNWHETDSYRRLSQSDKVTITLLSHLLLRTNEGAFADDLGEEMLPEPLKTSLKLVRSFKRVVPVGGFNRKWGLPLDQAYVIQAGSVFVFEVTQNVSAAEVRAVENAGIGERRAEGFGRIAINWPRAAELTVREIRPEDSFFEPVAMTPISQALAQKMVQRLLRRDLDRLLAGQIQRLKLKDNLQPMSNAQLSRLRIIALNALPKRDIKRLLEFLCDQNLKAKARTQFWMARIADRRALEWLRQQLETPTMVWQHLREGRVDIPLPRLGTVEAELTDDLAKEYTIRLIAGILHRAAKERKQQQKNVILTKEGKVPTDG
jgi:CRISPR-associated protein Csx10